MNLVSSRTSLNGTLPYISLNSGGVALYDHGNGTSELRFLYTIGEGESTADLDVEVVARDVTSTAAIVLPASGVIFDVKRESAAVVTVPKPGTGQSLGDNRNIVIDTT